MDFRISALLAWCIALDFAFGDNESTCKIRFLLGNSFKIFKQCISPSVYKTPCFSSTDVLVVKSIFFLKNKDCTLRGHERGYEVKEAEDERTWKIIRAACNGRPQCHKPSDDLLYNCDGEMIRAKDFDVGYICELAGNGGDDDGEDAKITTIIIIVISSVAVLATLITAFLCLSFVCNWNTPLKRWATRRRNRARQQGQRRSQHELKSQTEGVYLNVNGNDAKTQDPSSSPLIAKGQMLPAPTKHGNVAPRSASAKNADFSDYTEIPDDHPALSTSKTPVQQSRATGPSLQVLPAVHDQSASAKHVPPKTPSEAESQGPDPQYSSPTVKQSTASYSSTTSDKPSVNAKPCYLPSASHLNVATVSVCPESGVDDVTYSVVVKEKVAPKPVVLSEGVYSVASLSTTSSVTTIATYHKMDSPTKEYTHLKRPGDEQPVSDNVYDG